MMKGNYSFLLPFLVFNVFLLITTSFAFQSDELLADDEEFGLEGGPSPDLTTTRPAPTSPSLRKRPSDSGSDSDSKIQFPLEHAFGDSEFSPAGTFSARLKTSSHGGQTLTKLRFSRNVFSEIEKENFKRLLEGDDFYRIRLPSNVLNAPGREYTISSAKAVPRLWRCPSLLTSALRYCYRFLSKVPVLAKFLFGKRCLPRDSLDEHFLIHMEGVNIVAVNYGSPGSCQYPRQLKLPANWSFKSHTVLKNSDLAPRTPVFTEEVVGELGEGEEDKPLERSFWAKYWMYLIPLGFILMNAMTQAMNMADEPGTGQPGSQTQQAVAGRGQPAAVRRR